jgi:hypothetical protein
MKNKLLWVALASMTFAACSNDEVVTEQQNSAADAIGFRTAITNSRASEVSLATLKDKDKGGFWVNALKTGERTTKEWQSPVKFAWDGEKFSVANSADEKEWDSYSLEFYASNLDPDKGYKFQTPNAADGAATYVSFSPARDVADQIDFVYASNKGSRNDFSGTVPLTFNHALAQVQIRAKYNGTSYKVRCKGYKLVYLDGKNSFDFGSPSTNGSQIAANNSDVVKGTWGTVEFSTGENAADCWSGFYGGNGYAADYYASGALSDTDADNHCILLDADYQVINGGDGDGTAMLLPQEQAALGENGTGFYLALLVQIDKLKDDGTGNYEPYYPSLNLNDPLKRIAYRGVPKYYGFATIPITIKWEAGKKYIYDLDLSSGFGYADPADPGLANPNDTSYDPKDDRDNNGDDKDDGNGNKDNDDNFQPGKPIIGTNITFKYTIIDLATGNTQTITL